MAAFIHILLNKVTLLTRNSFFSKRVCQTIPTHYNDLKGHRNDTKRKSGHKQPTFPLPLRFIVSGRRTCQHTNAVGGWTAPRTSGASLLPADAAAL